MGATITHKQRRGMNMIRFKMFRISTGQFAILSTEPPKGEVEISTNIELKHANDGSAVMVNATFTFSEKERQVMVLGTTCEFSIHPEDLQALTTDGKVVIPKGTIDFFIAQTVGTARGILHCKTEGTPFNGIIIPPMNVTGMFKDDMVINIK